MTSNWTKYFQDSAYFFFIQTICRSRIKAKRQQLKLVVLKKTIHDFAAEFPYLFPPCVFSSSPRRKSTVQSLNNDLLWNEERG